MHLPPSESGQRAPLESFYRSLGVLSISLHPLWRFTLIALAVKTVLLVADPNPQFFLGDSGSYLYTALTDWIPLDRSYLYGYLIRWLAIGSGSLFSLVLVQTLASALSAGVLGWVLLRFLSIRIEIATAAVLIYSVEPLQLLYERFVMAETFSLLAAVLFIAFLFVFLESGRKRFLVFSSFAGLVSVALRMSFLPPVLVLSFSAPVIRFLFAPSEEGESVRARRRALLLALFVVTISYLTLHNGYKILTGRLAGGPPAYQYADGLFLLAAWSPVMTPADLRAAGVSEQVVGGHAHATLENRRGQRWMQSGIVSALGRYYRDPKRANAVAKKISLQILRRDPIGVAGLGVRTYFRGWQRKVIQSCIKEDLGDRPIPPDLAKSAARHFHIVTADMPKRVTLAKAYFRHGKQWYRALLLTPLLLLSTVFFCDRPNRPYLVFLALYAGLVLLTATGLAVDNSIRYLHPLAWAFFVFGAFWVNFALSRFRRH